MAKKGVTARFLRKGLSLYNKEELLPPDEYERIMAKYYRHRKRLGVRMGFRRSSLQPDFESELRPQCYYAATLSPHAEMVVIPQPWFHLETAKRWWAKRLDIPRERVDSLMAFYKGTEVEELNLTLKRVVYFSGKTYRAPSKVMLPLGFTRPEQNKFITRLKLNSGGGYKARIDNASKEKAILGDMVILLKETTLEPLVLMKSPKNPFTK